MLPSPAFITLRLQDINEMDSNMLRLQLEEAVVDSYEQINISPSLLDTSSAICGVREWILDDLC